MSRAGAAAVILAAICTDSLPRAQAGACEADWILPESLSAPEPFALSTKSEKQAEAIARYLQSIFEEEADGPDRSLQTKRQVLDIDPSFSDLAVEVAHYYLRRGETTEALSVLKDASKSSPKNPGPNLALSAIYLRHLEKPALAEKFALAALASSPQLAAPYENLNEIYMASAQPQKADALFQKALGVPSTEAAFWISLAEIQIRNITRKGKLPSKLASEKILPFLKKAAPLASDDAQSLSQTADYLVVCSAVNEAVPLYRRALEIAPDLEGAREKLTACHIQNGDTREAIRCLEEIVAKNPLDLPAYDQLAQLHLREKNLPRALSNLRQGLLIAPGEPRRFDDVIRLSFQAGDAPGALDASTEASKRFPKVLEFAVLRAMALGENNRHEEAFLEFERIFQEALKSRPDILNSDFHFGFGAAAERSGRYSRAAELLRKSIELDPDNSARACNYLGYMWAERGENLAEAEELIRSALNREPSNGAYRDSLGWALFKQGKYAEAVDELLQAAGTLTEPDAVVFEHIGDAMEKLGRTAEAVLYWKKALQADPSLKSVTSKLDAHSSRVASQPTAPTPQTQGH